jgi:hypothetical protein
MSTASTPDLGRDADRAARGRAALQRLVGRKQLLLFVAHACGGIRRHMNS